MVSRPSRNSGPHRGGAELARLAPLARRGVGRRALIRGAGLSALALGSPSLLAACGTEGAQQSADTCRSEDLSSSEKTLNFSNRPECIDVERRKVEGKKQTVIPTLLEFGKKTGIKVTYNADVNDNAEFFAKVRNQLGDCQPTGRDIFVLSAWMAGRVVELGWIQELDHANMPNVDAQLLSNLRSPQWDPERRYRVPWQSGFTGIAYNAMLKLVGADTEDSTEDSTEEQFGQALDKLEEYVASGQIRRFTGDDYIRDLNAGNSVAAQAWSGDVMVAHEENPDIRWVVPEEGLSLWSDTMLVPNKATHKTNAEKLIDHYDDPQVAAELAAWVWYVSPVEGEREAMEKVDAALVDEPPIFPDEDFLANAWGFMALDESTAPPTSASTSR